MNRLIENEHYYFDENGLMVLTEKYLLERGFCCGNGCRHCPYGKLQEARLERLEDKKT